MPATAKKATLSERLPAGTLDTVRKVIVFAETAEAAARNAMGDALVSFDVVRSKVDCALEWWGKAAYECGVAKMQKEHAACIRQVGRVAQLAYGAGRYL